MAFLGRSEQPWFSANGHRSDVIIDVNGAIFHLHRGPLVSMSAKLANMLINKNSKIPTCITLPDCPGGPELFELAMKFCYSQNSNVTPDTAIPLYCIAAYLDMTKKQHPKNLLKLIEEFLYEAVLPYWNECVRALRSCTSVSHHAVSFGPVRLLSEAIAAKVAQDPSLLGPQMEPATGAKRRLFDCSREDLTTLSLELYKSVISVVISSGVSRESVAGSLFRYASVAGNRTLQRDVIEVVEELLPKGVATCDMLSELLRRAVYVQASDSCRSGLERRLSLVLDKASVSNLLVPAHGYSRHTQFDLGCPHRIVRQFVEAHVGSDLGALSSVCGLIDQLLVAVAPDPNLGVEEFMLIVSSVPTRARTCADELYRAIDVYLSTHSFLTESEREGLCRDLDCGRLSPEACAHAVRNERLPMRVALRVLMVGQLQLRDEIVGVSSESEAQNAGGSSSNSGELQENMGWEGVRLDMEKMEGKLLGLEEEWVRMRKEIEGAEKKERKKVRSLWKVVWGGLGCNSNGALHVSEKNKRRRIHLRNQE
ncbi:hypothetical protein AMTR_s00017p00088320 [Amborella trichopoda]|uniref:NPH3 domain-containing protein n=3 Tax=Amborella trichopoda TaxID=13333 RepID=W1PN02_AMBTC|nr:hypothetical protein AMTR_s00017p00088320 [Amborella trichopoda]